MVKKTEKLKVTRGVKNCNMGTMTESQKRQMIISDLRKRSIYWKPIQFAKKRQKIKRVELKTDKQYFNPTKTMPTRISNTYKVDLYKCQKCKREVPEKVPLLLPIIISSGPMKGISSYKIKLRSNVNVDHIFSVVTGEGFKDWTTYIERMFDEDPNNYQLLCRDCHKDITDKENQARKKNKK